MNHYYTTTNGITQFLHRPPASYEPLSTYLTPHVGAVPKRHNVLDNAVFVFGSNLAGRHGKGAALYAKDHKGAVYGVGKGRTGNSYALPTKDYNIKTLPLDDVKVYVDEFLDYAHSNPDTTFYVTKVGCGLAGFAEDDIKPLFVGAPDNCILPSGWGKRFHAELLGSKRLLVPQGGEWVRKPNGLTARLFVHCKTRKKDPFFVHPEPVQWDGSLLGLKPTIAAKERFASLKDLCNWLNLLDWDELGCYNTGRYQFQQRSLANLLVPR